MHNDLLSYLNQYPDEDFLGNVFGILVFGSVARRSDVSKSNDVDMLVVLKDGILVNDKIVDGVHLLIRNISEKFAIIADPVVCNKNQIKLTFGPVLADDLIQAGLNVWGGDVTGLLMELRNGFSPMEMERRLLKRMFFTRDNLRRLFCALGTEGKPTVSETRTLAKGIYFIVKDLNLMKKGQLVVLKTDYKDFTNLIDKEMLNDDNRRILDTLSQKAFLREEFDWGSSSKFIISFVEEITEEGMNFFRMKYEIAETDLELMAF